MSPRVNWRRTEAPPRVVNCVRVLGRAVERELSPREFYVPRCSYVLAHCGVVAGDRPVGVCALDEGPGRTLRAIAVAGLLATRQIAATNLGGLDAGEVLDFFRDTELLHDARTRSDRAMLQASVLHLLSGDSTR